MTPEDILKLQKELKELKEVADQLQYSIPDDWLSKPTENSKNIKKSLELWKNEIKEIKNDFSAFEVMQRNSYNELTKGNEAIKLGKRGYRGLLSIATQLADEQDGINELDKHHLNILSEKNASFQRMIETSIEMEGLNNNERESLEGYLKNLKIQNSYIEDRLELEQAVNKELGLSGVAVETLQKLMWRLGGSRLSDYLGIDDAMQKTKESARDLLTDQEQFGKYSGVAVNKFRSLGTLAKNLGKNLMKSIGPAALLAGVIAGLIDALKQIDGQTGDIAQQLGFSYEHSIGLTQQLNDIAGSSENIWITSANITESFLTLSDSLSTNVMLSSELLTNFTQLTKQIGLTQEAALTLSKISLITNKQADQLSKEYLGQIKLLNIKNDTAINEKTLLNEIAGVSQGLLLTFSKQPQELAKAAFEAKKLGLEIKTIEGLATSLLDIESSITAEFEAEVLTGRMLNLERARYYALTNDIAGLAKEINQQGITSVEFSKMNRIQQDSIAKAIGLSRDEMGKMLMEQEAIRAVGAENLDDLKSKLAIAQAQGKEEEFMKQIGNEQYENLLQSQSASDRFTQSMNKLKEIFIQLVDPLMPVLEVFVDIMSVVGKITKFLDPVLKLVGIITGGIGDILSMIGGDFDFSSVKTQFGRFNKSIEDTWGGNPWNYGYRGITSTKKINDGVIDEKGNIQVSSPKGTIQLDDNDTFIGNKNGIVAGTDLMGNNSGGQITKMSEQLNNKLEQLVGEIKIMSQKLEKGMIVNLDGTKVSKEILNPLMMSVRNT